MGFVPDFKLESITEDNVHGGSTLICIRDGAYVTAGKAYTTTSTPNGVIIFDDDGDRYEDINGYDFMLYVPIEAKRDPLKLTITLRSEAPKLDADIVLSFDDESDVVEKFYRLLRLANQQ